MKAYAHPFDALVASLYPQLKHLLALPDANKNKLLYFLEEAMLPGGDHIAQTVIANLEKDTCETIIRKHEVAQDIVNYLRAR